MSGETVTIPRREIIHESKPGAYHITTRCVRRTFLRGKDSNIGADYEHRRSWIREHIRLLVEIYAIDMLGYFVMSNHMHLVPRNRPDLAKLWSAEEVAKRWLRVDSTHQSAMQHDSVARLQLPINRKDCRARTMSESLPAPLTTG